MAKLQKLIAALDEFIPHARELNKEVSKRDVGWHVDHISQVANRSIESIQQSDNPPVKFNRNIVRLAIFMLGFIPRGKAKAPKAVKPEESKSEEQLKEQLDATRKNIEAFEQWPRGKNFDHPYFGRINVPMSRRFLELHTKHHLKIIKDILKKG